MTKRSSAKGSGRPAKVRVKSVKRLLRDTAEELAAAKALLKQDESRAKRAKSKLGRENAKRAAKLVKKTMESHQGSSGAPVGEEWEVTSPASMSSPSEPTAFRLDATAGL